MEIYLVRHGQTDSNVKATYTGQSDVPMNEEGIRQIESIRPALSGIKWNRVITSPLDRAYKTAMMLCHGTMIETDERLMEMDFGAWTGLTWREAEAKDQFAWRAAQKDWQYAKQGGGECFMDVYNRVELAIGEIISKARPTDKILITSHAAPVRIITMVLLELPQDTYWRLIPAQGAYQKLSAYPDAKPWFSLAGWNIGPDPSWRS